MFDPGILDTRILPDQCCDTCPFVIFSFLYARKNFGHIMLYPLATSVRLSVRPLAIWFPEYNVDAIWPIIFKIRRMFVHIGQKTPIDFGVTRLKVNVTITLKLKTISGALHWFHLVHNIQTS
jgi:hypothetical protein